MNNCSKEGILQRINELREYTGMSKSTLAASIGMEQTTLNNQFLGKRAISIDLVIGALKSFEEISAEWLLRGTGSMLIQKEETEPGMDKLKSIVYTIANLQDEINEKTMLTQRLLEENQKLKGELAMLKNERNIG